MASERSPESYFTEIHDWAAIGLSNLAARRTAQVRENLTSIADLSAAALAPPEPPPDPTPPDPDPQPVLVLRSGRYAYGPGARQWGNLSVPATPRVALMQCHGGGWMMGDPNVAASLHQRHSDLYATHGEAYADLLTSPRAEMQYFGLAAMASYAAARWGAVVWEPAYTYSSGNPDVCLADVLRARAWFVGQLTQAGLGPLPLFLSGHSAGGQLALRAALTPSVPAPAGVLLMAAAGLTVHQRADVADAPGGFSYGGTGWIFQTAWGPEATWKNYAPDTHLRDRPERFPVVIEQGSLNGHDDGSVNVRWATNFVPLLQQAGWPYVYHEQVGADHFAIRWDQSSVTRGDMDTLLGR